VEPVSFFNAGLLGGTTRFYRNLIRRLKARRQRRAGPALRAAITPFMLRHAKKKIDVAVTCQENGW
jgi:formate hydrogenlyase subunit 4